MLGLRRGGYVVLRMLWGELLHVESAAAGERESTGVSSV